MDSEKQKAIDKLEVLKAWAEAKKQVKCKHKFKPRYTKIYSSLIEEKLDILAKHGGKITVGSMPWEAGERELKEKIYIYDVCVKCGMIIKSQ